MKVSSEIDISQHAIERGTQRVSADEIRLSKAWEEGITVSWQFGLESRHGWHKMPKNLRKFLKRKYKDTHYKVFGDMLLIGRDNTLITLWRLSNRRVQKINLKIFENLARDLHGINGDCPATKEALLLKYGHWFVRMVHEGWFDDEDDCK